MNLELLDPFGRQVPDRIDATLPLAPHLHFQQPLHQANSSNKKGDKANLASDHKFNTININNAGSNAVGTGLLETGGTTLSLNNKKRDFPEWRAANHISYNRRGTYLAVGYGSGAVAVHSTSSRTLSALYRSQGPGGSPVSTVPPSSPPPQAQLSGDLGITSVSWSRRSRTLLAGARGQASITIHDATHPLGADDACMAIDPSLLPEEDDEANRTRNYQIGVSAEDGWDHIPPDHSRKFTKRTAFADPPLDETKYILVRDKVELETVNVSMGSRIPDKVQESFQATMKVIEKPKIPEVKVDPSMDPLERKRKRKEERRKHQSRLTKHPSVSLSFNEGNTMVGGSLQINPRCPTGGLAALTDGSLVVFWFDPDTSWVRPVGKSKKKTPPKMPTPEGESPRDAGEEEVKASTKYAIVVPLWNNTVKHFITCAAFDPQGERVYAASKDGTLMGFEVKLLFDFLMSCSPSRGTPPIIPSGSKTVVASPIKGGIPLVTPKFKVNIPGGASAWHLLVSRNAKYLVLNSSDGALRLYSAETCWNAKSKDVIRSSSLGAKPQIPTEKPLWTFQDVVSKTKFVSCDLSGDGEYIVGGANSNDNRYELSIWNTSTGNLMDKLTGPTVQLYSVAWHPTRAQLAVATSDGIVDVWGPKMNWTDFAPDFQALHKNVVYKEEEETTDSGKQKDDTVMEVDTVDVDVLTIAPIPVFASDSEEEVECFAFETRLKNLFQTRAKTGKGGLERNDD